MMAVTRDNLLKIIVSLEADLPKLELEECYQKHEPAYYNYVMYYEDLVELLLNLGSSNKKALNLYGAYLTALLAYQVMELKKPLAEAVKLLINELKIKANELVGIDAISSDDEEDEDTSKCQA